jgi:hypothetical protein
VAYTDQATLAKDATFRDRVRVAAVTAAILIGGEAVGGVDTTVYGKRQQLASEVLLAAGGGNWLDVFAWSITQNAAITGSSTDSDIQFTCNSVWNDIAGITIVD